MSIKNTVCQDVAWAAVTAQNLRKRHRRQLGRIPAPPRTFSSLKSSLKFDRWQCHVAHTFSDIHFHQFKEWVNFFECLSDIFISYKKAFFWLNGDCQCDQYWAIFKGPGDKFLTNVAKIFGNFFWGGGLKMSIFK